MGVSDDDFHRLRQGWEHRLPDLSDEWTHWWIEGDGRLLGVLSGQELVAALQLVADNWRDCDSVYAYRGRIASDGQMERQENRRYEVSNRKKDERASRR